MSIFFSLSTFALRQLADGACAALGVPEGGDQIMTVLTARFTDHSQRLNHALQNANDRAWKSLEIALAGESLWNRCKGMLTRAEDKAFAQQVRLFLDAAPLPEPAGQAAFRQKCLEELRAARHAKAMAPSQLDPRLMAQQVASFARFGDPQRQIEAEWQTVQQLAGKVQQAGYANLGWLLAQRPVQGQPILVAAVRYFFRRAVEEDTALFQGLSFARLESLAEGQDKGFAALSATFTQQGQRLEELLDEVKVVVVQTHAAVLDLQQQVSGQNEQLQQINQAVMKLLEEHQLQRREVRPGDSLSIRNDAERQLVKQVVSRYRALPEQQRKQAPALLNAVGKLELVAGDFDAAQQDFQQAATLTSDDSGRAEAHFNAYRAALERRDWRTALAELLNAAKLDGQRFSPFPIGKYQPLRILGAGGFGVAFACRHKELQANVVVKTLTSDDLSRDVDEVFSEARVLYALEHPGIIRLLDCGYTLPAEKARPYFVMNFFDGKTLEEYVEEHGPLSPGDLVSVARQTMEGLHAAHSKGILHRDVKPANLLVRKEEAGWHVKLIDFGLALKQHLIAGAHSTQQSKTITGSSIAGTLDYGAPEQMGKLPGVPVGRYSDVYGFGKTCCYALFKTTQPLPKHFRGLPAALTELLEDCLEQAPEKRPADCAAVLARLKKVADSLNPPEAVAAGEQWHHLRGGQQVGPISEEEMKQLAASGKLLPADLVWKNGMPQWAAAGSAKAQWFQALPPAPPPAPVAPATEVRSVLTAALEGSVGAAMGAIFGESVAPAAPVPVKKTGAKVKIVNGGEDLVKKAISAYMAAFGVKALLKVYFDGEFIGEEAIRTGFEYTLNVETGKHVLEVAHWENGEKDRKSFDLNLDQPGEYEIRYNHVWTPGFLSKGNMQGSTIDVRKPSGSRG